MKRSEVPERNKRVVKMWKEGGKSMREIAEHFEISRSYVWVMVKRDRIQSAKLKKDNGNV